MTTIQCCGSGEHLHTLAGFSISGKTTSLPSSNSCKYTPSEIGHKYQLTKSKVFQFETRGRANPKMGKFTFKLSVTGCA
jgi:hypothetical protein